MIAPASDRPNRWSTQLRARLRGWHRQQGGMTTAEYAVGTLAAVAFAAVLYRIVTSGAVHAALLRLVTDALQLGP